MKKRIVSLLLALLMILTALPTVLLPSLAIEAPSAQSALESTDAEPETADPYAALYVQDNLIFRWDAFDSVASSGTSNLTLADRDGRSVTLTLPNATKHKGYVSSKENFDFSSLVPKDGVDYADFSFDASIVQVLSSTNGWPALNLGTLPLTAGTGGSKAPFESYGNVYGTYHRYLTNKSTTVTYYFSEDGALLSEKPADGSYKTVPVPYLTRVVEQAAFGEDWSPRFYGNYENESYSIGASLDYTQTDGYGTIKLALYRDMQNVKTFSNMVYARGHVSTTKSNTYGDYVEIVPAAADGKTAYEVALQMAERSPAANGTYKGETDSGIFSFGGKASSSQIDIGYYAFRLYSDILTPDEYLQNHFADLCAYHKIDNVSLFLSLDNSSKKALYTQFSAADVTKGNVDIYNTSYEDVSKQELDEAILDAYAEKAGLFDRDYITFDGYQASLYSAVGIRARYTLSKQALAQIPEGMALAEVGVLSAPASDFSIDDLNITQGTDGKFVAPIGVNQTIVQQNGENKSGVIEDTADALTFADTFLYNDTLDGEDVFSERVYRAYAVFMSGDNPIIVYTDAIGETESFKNGVSLYEIAAVLCTCDENHIKDSAVKEVLLTVMNHLDQLEDTFEASFEELLVVRNGAIGEGTTFASRVSEVESLLASTKELRNKAFTTADSDVRSTYLQTAGNALSTLTTYTADMLSFKKNDAQTAADALLVILERMKSEYENLRSFSTAMNLGDTDDLFKDMQAKIEEAETLYCTFLPKVKETYDHFAAVKSVLNTFWNEINGAKGDGSGVTQIFLFGASTTTTASYPTKTHFPFQGMGYEFDEYFDNTIRVVNPSLAGWSLKALTGSSSVTKENIEALFAPENSPWAKMLMQLNPGDYVIFGSTCTNEKWQTGGDVYYIENADGTYSIVDEKTPGAKFYSVKQTEAEYREMLVKCFKILIDMGVTPIIHTSTGNIGLSSTKPNANDTSRFTGGTRSYEDVKILAVNDVNTYYQNKNGNKATYAYHADVAERCREVYLADMQSGLTFNQVLDRYNQTQGAIEAFYETYGFVGSKYNKHIETDEKFKIDYVHQNIRGALLVSSFTLKELQGSGIPLLDHVVTFELDEVELVCNTLKEAGVTYTDPRK